MSVMYANADDSFFKEHIWTENKIKGKREENVQEALYLHFQFPTEICSIPTPTYHQSAGLEASHCLPRQQSLNVLPS